MSTNNKKNVGIIDDSNTITATDIRIKKCGQYTLIQFSTDGGKTYKNIEEAYDKWIHLFITELGDINGDGQSDIDVDDIISQKEDIDKLKTDVNTINSDIDEIEEDVDDIQDDNQTIQFVSDNDIDSLFES